jgi:hypothetical protein
MAREFAMTATVSPSQRTSPLSCDEALSIARLDAERVYRDVSPYRITLALEPDGWHVDYQLKDQLLKGGGPHYVIDATTGAILHKRYEQ